MAFIYVIKNDINDKVYIGKTHLTVQKRFKQHISDASKDRCKNRAIYYAMRKYGIEHFSVEMIEETDNPEDREVFWIQHYDSYHHGYNCTIGGDGKPYIDRQLVISVYQKNKNAKKTAKELNIDSSTVTNILAENNITVYSRSVVNVIEYGKKVSKYSLENEFIESFHSGYEAARSIDGVNQEFINGVKSHIMACCKGKRKTAYGYMWRFTENNGER